MTRKTIILSSRERRAITALCRAIGYRSAALFTRSSLPPDCTRYVPATCSGRPIAFVGELLSPGDVAPGVALFAVEMRGGVPHCTHLAGDPEALRALRNHRLKVATPG